MANELDILMDLDPLTLASTEGGIEAIVAILRQKRAQSEAGIKPVKEKGPKVTIDLEALGIKKPTVPIGRRI